MVKTLENMLELIATTFVEKTEVIAPVKKVASKSALNLLSSVGDIDDYGKKIRDEMIRQREQVHLAVSSRESTRPMVGPHFYFSLASFLYAGRVFHCHQGWKPIKIFSGFPGKITCGDSWGDQLIIASPSGVYFLRGTECRMIWDCETVVQLAVVDHVGLLLALTSKGGKGGYLYAIQLSVFNEGNKLTGKCERYRIDKIKGTFLSFLFSFFPSIF